MDNQYQLFSWALSYFSAKTRAYLRYKQWGGALEFEDVFATFDIVNNYLVPATGTNVVPQLKTPEGEWLEDTSAIFDIVEARHPEPSALPATPRQRVSSFLIELLADEWMLPYGFYERWHYSLEGVEPNHEAYNALQWGALVDPFADGKTRQEQGRMIFSLGMNIGDPDNAKTGPYAGLRHLGVTQETVAAWTASTMNIMSVLDTHLSAHDYVMGGRPSLADFALLGPIYPHLTRDPAMGGTMRARFPFVADWIERTNGNSEPGVRSHTQNLYRLEEGALVAGCGTSDGGAFFANDEIPETLGALLKVFFDEMWPVLASSVETLNRYLDGANLPAGTPLPTRSFYSDPKDVDLQTGDGPLVHEFKIGGVKGTRMVSAYHVWMLQRVAGIIAAIGTDNSLEEFLAAFNGGRQVLALAGLLEDIPLGRANGQIVTV